MFRWAIILSIAIYVAQPVALAAPAHHGDRCWTSPDPQWSALEQRAWTRHICVGKDLDLRPHDPTRTADLSSRTLSARFIEMILLDDPWRAALTPHGVAIFGARFATPINLENAHIAHDLSFVDCIFENQFAMATATIDGDLTFDGSSFAQDIDLERIVITKAVFFNRAHFNSANLLGAKISNSLAMRGTRSAAYLTLEGAEIGTLDLYSADLVDLNASRSKIDFGYFDQLNMTGDLEMYDAIVSTNLFLREATLKSVDFIGSKFGGSLEMDRAWVTSKLNLDSITVGRNIYARDADFPDVIMDNSKITNFLSFDRSRIGGVLSLTQADIGSLSAPDMQADVVRLTSAHVAGPIQMLHIIVNCELNMESMTGGSYLSLQGSTIRRANMQSSHFTSYADLADGHFHELLLSSAKVDAFLTLSGAELTDASFEFSTIGANLVLDGGKIHGSLNMGGAAIGGDLFIRRASIDNAASLIYLTTGDIWLSANHLSEVDLTGSRIRGMLTLTDRDGTQATWSEGGNLILRNATAALIQGRLTSWPASIDLRGFEYGGFGGFNDPRDDISKFTPEDFRDWMGRSRPFSPQPYEHLASILQKSGYAEETKSVLLAARLREHRETDILAFGWWLKAASLVFLGYGYLPYLILIWIAGFVAIGAMIVNRSGEARRLVLGTGIAFSFDRLIPLVRLEDRHYSVTLIPWVRNYFYFHQIMGYVFGTFLIGWLGGIVK